MATVLTWILQPGGQSSRYEVLTRLASLSRRGFSGGLCTTVATAQIMSFDHFKECFRRWRSRYQPPSLDVPSGREFAMRARAVTLAGLHSLASSPLMLSIGNYKGLVP